MRVRQTTAIGFLFAVSLTVSCLHGQHTDAASLAREGLQAARQEHYGTAIDFYKQALALDANLPGLEMNLGLAYFKSAQFAEAIQSFKLERKRHPDNARLGLLLGMSHYGMGDYLVAIPYLRQAADRDPANLALRLTLAHSCLWSKQYECVMTAYKEILALNAESAEADMLAGEALDAMGDANGAMEQFRAAVKANPEEPTLHYAIGYLLWTQSKYVEAAGEFQAELNHNPTNGESMAYLGDSFLQTGDTERAKAALDMAARAAPNAAMVHRDRGTLLAQAGDDDAAAREFRRAMELDPADVAPHWKLARLLQAEGRKEEAAKEFAIASGMVKQTDREQTEKVSGASAAPK